MKRMILLALTLMLTAAAAFPVSAQPSAADPAARPDLARLSAQLAAMDERNGTRSFIDESVDPATVKLQFNTIEEYEAFIRSIEIVMEDSTLAERSIQPAVSAEADGASAAAAVAATLKKSIYKDAKIYGSGVYLGKLRNKVVVKYYYNATFGQYRFYSWVSQSSYPTGTVYFTWDQDYETHAIVDSQRTLLSTVNGHLTVGAIVGGIYIGTMEVEDLVYSYGYTML